MARRFLFLVTVFLLAVFLTKCVRAVKGEASFNGRLRGDKVVRVLNNMNDFGRLRISSRGGLASTSLQAAQIIQLKKINIVIKKYCISGCAEKILPAASKVSFIDDPIIGFHQNILSSRYAVKSYAGDYNKYCNWLYARETEQSYSSSGHNVLFWQETMKRLKPEFSFDYAPKKCPKTKYVFENQLWLPASDQLSELLGLKFSGSVCADDFEKCKKKVDRSWGVGTRIVIGDEIYISKGHWTDKVVVFLIAGLSGGYK